MKILVAGIGNIFHGDDAFGVEVASLLAARTLPSEVEVVDFGIRAFDLACALDRYDVTVMVDAAETGGVPGTLRTIEIPGEASSGQQDGGAPAGMHALNPTSVLQMAKQLGGNLGRILLVGCQPETLGSEEEGRMGLSATVAGTLQEAADVVEALVNQLLEESRHATHAGAAV
jgi:hydrogenase maturation protease